MTIRNYKIASKTNQEYSVTKVDSIGSDFIITYAIIIIPLPTAQDICNITMQYFVFKLNLSHN